MIQNRWFGNKIREKETTSIQKRRNKGLQHKLKKKNKMTMIFKREEKTDILQVRNLGEKQNNDNTQNRKQWSLSRKKTQEKNKTITRTRRGRGGRN